MRSSVWREGMRLRNDDYVDENCTETEERTQLQGESQSEQGHQTL